MRALASVLAATLAVSATTATAGVHRAEITRTAYGIPHVVAKDWASLGFGEAYAYAEDNLCMLADKVVTVAGERSANFGTDGVTTISFVEQPNLESDVFFRSAIDLPTLRRNFATKASPEYRALVAGYVAGYNKFLADRAPSTRPAACRDAAWVRPISLDDMLRLNEEKSVQASGGAWLRQTTGAVPPGAPTKTASLGYPAELESFGLGSNGWAFGRDVTANKSGVLLGNPHFPWEGANRFYEMHLTIPGKLDVMGVTIGGAPGMSIGFNKDVAWTHTVSTDRHFTLAELTLDPTDPTTYLVDGKPMKMTVRTISVPVKGEATPRTRTLYSTIYGPVVTAPQAGLKWTAKSAYALQDANRDNLRGGDAWLDISRAKSVGEIRSIIIRTLGMPWVNTIAADRNGDALYADVTSTPNVSTDKLKICAPPSGLGPLAAGQRVFLLDGARATCTWDKAAGAATPGLMPGASMPSVIRTDYVANSNDSYWLANGSAPVTGQPAIVGPTGTPQNLRTRNGLLAIAARLSGKDGLPGNKVDPAAVKAMLYRNSNLAAELVMPDLGTACADGPAPVVADKPVDIRRACEILTRWDRRMDETSVGPQLFIEFWKDAEKIPGVWATPFDAADPINTPRGLKSDAATTAKLRQALANAVSRLNAANVAIDAPWGEVQVATRGGLRIPVHGGEGSDGVLNAQQAKLVPGIGLVPYHGSSYIQVVTFDAKGPVVDAILTYSQSTDPDSPHFADQTRLHAQKGWVTLPFSKAAIAANAAKVTKVVSD